MDAWLLAGTPGFMLQTRFNKFHQDVKVEAKYLSYFWPKLQ
jgi:hypothetical protein